MATYYVKNGGDDSLDGLSDGNAWANEPGMRIASSVSDGTVLQPGDSVLFNRGDEWNEYLRADDAGTSGAYITYSAYGTGDRPIVNARIELPASQTSGNWVETDPGVSDIWVFQNSVDDIERLWFDGQEYNHALFAGPNSAVDSTYRWHLSGGTLSVYSDDANPADEYTLIQVNVQDYPFPTQAANIRNDYILLNELDLRGGTPAISFVAGVLGFIIDNCDVGKWSLVGMKIIGVDGGIVRDCTFDTDFTAGYFDAEAKSNQGNALTIVDANDWVVHDNVFLGWQHGAFDVYNVGVGTTNGNQFYDNELDGQSISYSRGFGVSGSVEGNCSGNTFIRNYIHDITIQNQIGGDLNVVSHCLIVDVTTSDAGLASEPNGKARGLSLASFGGEVGMNCSVLNNTFVNTAEAGFKIIRFGGDVTGNVIKNNIFYNCGSDSQGNDPAVAMYIDNDSSENIYENTYSNNLMYTSGTADIIYYQDLGVITVAEFNAAHGTLPVGKTDTIENNIQLDPEFVDEGNDNYHLLLSSPCISAGVDVSISTDYDGVNIGDPPEIGIYEIVIYSIGEYQKGPPKNQLHLIDPTILQQPVFRGLLYLQPFINLGGDSVMDLVRINGLCARNNNSEVVWGSNEYGPAMVNNGGWIDTNVLANRIALNNFTFIAWASTISTSSDRELLSGFYEDSSLNIRFGRASNQPALQIKTAAGYQNTTVVIEDHNDGLVHMFCGTSSPAAVKIYYEGIEVASEPAIDGEQGSSEENLWIGNTDEDYGWIGTISFAAAWDRPLSPTEINLLYKMGPSLTMGVGDFPIPYRGAIAAGTPGFNPAWAYNSNQVL